MTKKATLNVVLFARDINGGQYTLQPEEMPCAA